MSRRKRKRAGRHKQRHIKNAKRAGMTGNKRDMDFFMHCGRKVVFLTEELAKERADEINQSGKKQQVSQGIDILQMSVWDTLSFV